MQQRILIIEDDPDIGALLQMHTRDCATEVRLEQNGARGLLAAQSGVWDLIVLDWILPGLDGVTICNRLRAHRHELPILMLTARATEPDRIRGLDAGADDYVQKPFSVHELCARVRAQLRRAVALRSGPAPEPVRLPLALGPFLLDREARTARVAGRPLSLTTREHDLLSFFLENPRRTFTRDQLLAGVWGAGFDGYDHTVNSHINRLRAKIEPNPATPRHLVTVWGVGYRFDVDPLQ